MELTTEQGNRMIAEFMGWRVSNPEKGQPYRLYMPDRDDWVVGNWDSEEFNQFVKSEFMAYQVSWEKLMTAVEKIESINHPYQGRFAVIICANNCTIQSANFRSDITSDPPYYYSDHYGETKKQATWLAVVAFFQWYNSLPSIDTNLIKKNKEG